jgi:hypothetical protein
VRTEYWNGGNIQAAIESLMMARSLCEAMQRELHGDAIIHPRDYIGGSESKDYAADVVEWRGVLERIRELEQHFEQRAMQLDAFREKYTRPEVKP